MEPHPVELDSIRTLVAVAATQNSTTTFPVLLTIQERPHVYPSQYGENQSR